MNRQGALCCGETSDAWRPLNTGQRRARLLVGLALLLSTLALPWATAGWIALAIGLGWIGATHVLAAVTAYPGCPELGMVPSFCLGRWVRIGCGPWRWLDAKLRLKSGVT